MIVLDEQLADAQVGREFARWYKGTVTNITRLRPCTMIFVDVVPTLLRTVRNPTFVTINYTDFWRVILASPAHCVVCLKLRQHEALLSPQIVRRLLSQPEFRTKRSRMGYVISVSGNF